MQEQDSEVAHKVEYRDVPGFPGYRVGDDGSVWSCWMLQVRRPSRMGSIWMRMKASRQPSGHLSLRLCRNGERYKFLLHRLVLETFVGPCPEGMEGCHSPDNNPTNCRLENLRWGTHTDNMQDRVLHGTSSRGQKNAFAKLTDEQVKLLRERYGKGGVTMSVMASELGVSKTTVRMAIRGLTWGHVAQPSKAATLTANVEFQPA